MRKFGIRKRHVRRTLISSWRAGAFTLVEMLVSLAILTVALSVVGFVFNVTSKTVSQAAAISEMQAWTRQFILQLKADLAGCDPTGSELILIGRTQAAALTRADLEARTFRRFLIGDPLAPELGNYTEINARNNRTLDPVGADGEHEWSNPRADLLAFFTSRPLTSQAPPTNIPPGTNDPFAAGANYSPSFVVYGHGAKGAAIQSGTGFTWSTAEPVHIRDTIDNGNDPLVQSKLPITAWMLCRRATIIDSPAAYGITGPGLTGNQYFRGAGPYRNSDTAVFNRILRCEPLPYNNSRPHAGDVALLNYRDHLTTVSTLSLNDPYNIPNVLRSIFEGLLFLDNAGRDDRHIATYLAEPPTELASNIGLHALPACGWFQVEFLMPEDPRNSRDYQPVLTDPDQSQRYDMPRWTQVAEGATYMFVPDSQTNRVSVADEIATSASPLPNASIPRNDFAHIAPPNPPTLPTWPYPISARRIRMWPYAIRVTVKVFDPRGRISEPIERSVVHRFD